jgi:hypothetical protein
VYIDELLVIASKSFKDHLESQSDVVEKLRHVGLGGQCKEVLHQKKTRIPGMLDHTGRYLNGVKGGQDESRPRDIKAELCDLSFIMEGS